MSLINQVLKDLDKRGAHTSVGEATVRVVHGHGSQRAVWLVIAGAAGMLLLIAGAWVFWQSQYSTPAPVNVAMSSLPAEVQAASPVESSPVLSLVPKIDSVSPDPIFATGSAQVVTLNGMNFKEGLVVTLKDEGGKVYANRPIVSMTPERITLKINLGIKPSVGWVEVQNPDQTPSVQYKLLVQSASDMRSTQSLATSLPQASENRVKAPGTLPASVEGGVNKLPVQTTLQQQAENEFRHAYQLMRQGRNTEALASYEAVLQMDASHEQARQSMVSLLLERKRNADAEIALQEGLKINLQHANFAMLLARLQVEREALQPALETLLRTLPYAEKQANYLSFVAALMQRNNRHKEAIDYYQKALALKPGLGVWLMGMGISLLADQRKDEARDAFRQALDSNTLNSELQSYVNQQLRNL